MNRVKQGQRLNKPKRMPTALYAVLQRCWSSDPKERPSFSELTADLEGITRSQANAERGKRGNHAANASSVIPSRNDRQLLSAALSQTGSITPSAAGAHAALPAHAVIHFGLGGDESGNPIVNSQYSFPSAPSAQPPRSSSEGDDESSETRNSSAQQPNAFYSFSDQRRSLVDFNNAHVPPTTPTQRDHVELPLPSAHGPTAAGLPRIQGAGGGGGGSSNGSGGGGGRAPHNTGIAGFRKVNKVAPISEMQEPPSPASPVALPIVASPFPRRHLTSTPTPAPPKFPLMLQPERVVVKSFVVADDDPDSGYIPLQATTPTARGPIYSPVTGDRSGVVTTTARPRSSAW